MSEVTPNVSRWISASSETTFNGETTLERHVVAIDAVNLEEEMPSMVARVGWGGSVGWGGAEHGSACGVGRCRAWDVESARMCARERTSGILSDASLFAGRSVGCVWPARGGERRPQFGCALARRNLGLRPGKLSEPSGARSMVSRT